MLNYIRAECCKVLHRKYLAVFLLLMFLGEGLLVWGCVYTNANEGGMSFADGAGMLISFLAMGFYCTILTGDMVFSDQYKQGTLKNEVSFGVPRARIYLGKLIVECLTAMVLCVLVVAFYLGMCWLFLPHGASDGAVMPVLLQSLALSLPLWLGAQGLVNALFFTFRGSTAAAVTVAGVFAGAGAVFHFLGKLVHPVFTAIYDCLLTTPMDLMSMCWTDPGFTARCILTGGGWLLAATVVGLVIFHRREIN